MFCENTNSYVMVLKGIVLTFHGNALRGTLPSEMTQHTVHYIILELTTRMDTSSRTLFVRDSLTQGGGCPRHVERRVT